MKQHNSGVVWSEEYEHEDTCPLFERGHTIPESVANVVDDLRQLENFEAVASGCNSCTIHAIDRGVYYVAQGTNREYVYFGFTDKRAAYTLIGACVEAGVPYDWDGSSGTKVAVGVDDVEQGR